MTSPRECSAVAPAQQPAFQSFRKREEHQDESHDEKDQRDGQRRVVGALRELQHVAEPAAGGDELADHRAGKGEADRHRSEEHTSELQSLMRISYAVFCLKKKKTTNNTKQYNKTYMHIKSHLTYSLTE